MSAEPIKEVIHKWENEQITQEQVIGKILVWLQELQSQQVKLEARLFRLEQRR